MVGYSLTLHAHRRCRERAITQDDLALALAGEGVDFGDNCISYYCRKNRVRVILAKDAPSVLTVYRLTRREGRDLYAAMRTQGVLL